MTPEGWVLPQKGKPVLTYVFIGKISRTTEPEKFRFTRKCSDIVQNDF
jgi:hypothetical protein